MSNDIRRISIKEFRALGFVQEINRRLLHPCGLALEVIVDKETGEEKFGQIWDYREDPEGICFGEGVISADKCHNVDELRKSKEDFRLRGLGYIIQPPEQP